MSCGGEVTAERRGYEDTERRGSSAEYQDGYIQTGRPSFGVNGCTPVPEPPFEIDRRLLIDPRQLFVGSKIGEGAHGKVYEGKYGDQIIAIKVLNKGSSPEEKAVLEARFIREVNMMSRVKHENLVKFIGACKDPFMVIVTELLPGMSLRKYLNGLRPQKLDLHVVIRYALDIANAMDCLHANGIIHRDLKPDNLLLTANHTHVKLADFGLAREESVTEMMTAETGTYRWMAPELYSTVTLRRGEKKHYTNKVDVYSFGIVLWELLTNRMPFDGMSNLQAAYAAAFKQVRPELSDDMPQELVFIIQSCWVEDPNMRPSFSQITRMLNAFLYTLPPSSQPDTAADVAEESPKKSSLAITTSSSARSGSKFSFFKQIFTAAKKSGGSR